MADQEENGTIRAMKKAGIPLTRENYLNTAYMGNPPEEIGPEIEAMLPEEFRKKEEEEEVHSPD